MSIEKRFCRTYTDEFRNQVVQLYKNGKRKCDIIREYDITSFLLDKWVKQEDTSDSFKEKDNLTSEQKELMELRKRNKQFEMKNDILKKIQLYTPFCFVPFYAICINMYGDISICTFIISALYSWGR